MFLFAMVSENFHFFNTTNHFGGNRMKKRKTSKKAFLSALSLSVATGALVVSAPVATDAADKSFLDVSANLDHHGSR